MAAKEQTKRVGHLLEKTSRIVKLSFHKAFNDMGIDLTPEQWVLLDSLSAKNDRPQKSLANDSFKNAPTISRIIDVLVKKGWVERLQSDHDRRVYIIHLTTSGKQVVKKVRNRVKKLRVKSWENLSDRDYKTFERICNQIFENFDSVTK